MTNVSYKLLIYYKDIIVQLKSYVWSRNALEEIDDWCIHCSLYPVNVSPAQERNMSGTKVLSQPHGAKCDLNVKMMTQCSVYMPNHLDL
jgi:hypothetical protein